jgi:PAS domain S-box-containing protein
MIANMQELAQTLFEEAGDALFLFDPDNGRIVEVNPMAQRLCDAGRPALLKESVESLFRSEQQGGVVRLQRACKNTGVFHSQDGYFLRQRSAGTWLPVNLTVARLHVRPKTLGLITARDVSERRRAEAKLRDSEQNYRELFENAHDGIYTTDLDGQLTSVNSACEQLTGYTRQELIGKNTRQFVAPEFHEVMQRMSELKKIRGGTTTYEVEILGRAGQRIPVELTTQLIHRNGEPVGVQGIARDLRDRKLLEEQLRQAQKMEAIGQLAGGVAHDFNNLLTVITGYSEVLLNDLSASDPVRPSVREIRKSAERAAMLTSQLLAFSRRQILQPIVIDLNTLVPDNVKMLRRLIGEHIEIVTDLEFGLAQVKADPGQVNQALMNLAVNARDAMPQGGRLTIRTASAILDEKFVHNWPEVKPGEYARLSVADTGCGMDAETMAHIFEPFFTTKEEGKGTGLGLAMVYGFVKQSGGHITVQSEVGRGTTFDIYLPTIPCAERTPETSFPSHCIPGGGGSETVLLVEDEDGVRNLVRLALQMKGYTVLEASHGADALQICEKWPGPVDLLVTDVVMPKMGGRELAERLTEVNPKLRVLYLSGYTADALLRDGFGEGTPFLHKPFSPGDLARKVRELLDMPKAGGSTAA